MNIFEKIKLKHTPITRKNCEKLGFFEQSIYNEGCPNFHKHFLTTSETLALSLQGNNIIGISLYDYTPDEKDPYKVFTEKGYFRGKLKNMWELIFIINHLGLK